MRHYSCACLRRVSGRWVGSLAVKNRTESTVMARQHTAGQGKSSDVLPFHNSRFTTSDVNGSLQSARVVLQSLFEVHRPRSVFDLGCGQGAWLAAAEELGSGRLVGIDGPWVDPAALLSRNIQYSRVNLESDFAVPGKFDLCISVEVAEHLSPARADATVKTLCELADVVLFSAAIPRQGGIDHLNERWQSFGAARFASSGFVCHDYFRPRIWTDTRVESWYRQNLLLYVRHSHPLNEALLLKARVDGPLDIVHPNIFEGNLESFRRPMEEPTLRLCGEMLARWLRRQVRKVTPRRGRS